jgi:hypothetical protein
VVARYGGIRPAVMEVSGRMVFGHAIDATLAPARLQRPARVRWAGGLLVTALVSTVACGGGGEEDEGTAASTTQLETGADAEVEAQEFVTRPDLRPPVIDVEVSRSSTPGLTFLAPKQAGAQKGALILDDDGEVVWASPSDATVADFRVQTYRGEPVLTWWEGRSLGGYGEGEFVIADAAYREVARIPAGEGLAGDLHEFALTDEGTALVLAYEREPVDLSGVDGPRDGHMLNNYVQEIDIATGEVLLNWSARDHVPLTDTYSEMVEDAAATEERLDDDGSAESPFDWFHVNSVAEDGDGRLLVSARNTHAVYAIDRRTGEVAWTLGGRSSDFTMADGATFAWQHDARRLPDGTISIFDNQGDPPTADESRGLVLDLDGSEQEATVVRELVHPDKLLAGSQGNLQMLEDGGAVVGWGSKGRVTEFDAEGEVVFDATWFPADSYRVFRLVWTGRPDAPPEVVARPTDDGSQADVYVSWNGATDVTDWRVLGGPDRTGLEPLETVPKDGFETTVAIDAVDFVAVQALDESGAVLATSPPEPVAP